MDNLIIELSKHNDQCQQFEFKDGYSYEIHKITKSDLLEFANASEMNLFQDVRLYDVNYIVIRVLESHLNTKYKVLGIHGTYEQAQEQMNANKRDLSFIQ